MSVLTTGKYWAATAERAVKTAGQAFVAAVGVNVVALDQVNWELVGGTTLLAAVLSVATSIASIPVGGEGPSLGAEELAPKSTPPSV